jgi:hypothetical protein
MDDINRKRLEWCRDAKVGETFPRELFGNRVNSWGEACNAMARDALEEIQRLAVMTIYRSWEPIETAPVEDWIKAPSYYRFRCLLQLPTLTDGQPTVCEGYGYYVAAPRSKERRILRWSDGSHQCFPKYWMALPAPKED